MLSVALELVRRLWRRGAEDGQGLVEYGLILVLVVIVAILALNFVGFKISGQLSVIGSSV